MKRYVFRVYTGWTVWDPMVSESIITASSDQEAQEKAKSLADGRAFTCNLLFQ